MQSQALSRYAEPDNRDWRGRSGLSSSGDDRSWDALRESKEQSYGGNLRPQESNQYNRQDQLHSQFEVSAAQGVMT